MALPKIAIGQHKRMAMGEKNIGFKKGGEVQSKSTGGAVQKKKSGGSCYGVGGEVKKGK